MRIGFWFILSNLMDNLKILYIYICTIRLNIHGFWYNLLLNRGKSLLIIDISYSEKEKIKWKKIEYFLFR